MRVAFIVAASIVVSIIGVDDAIACLEFFA